MLHPGLAAALWTPRSSVSSPPVVTYIGSSSITTDFSTHYSTAGINIGTAAADRIVVVVGQVDNNCTIAGTSTIAGVTATIVVQNTSGAAGTTSVIAYAAVPTGTTGTITLDFNVDNTGTSMIGKIYTITGWSSATPTGSSSGQQTGTAQSININTTSGGVIIAGAANKTTASQSCTISGTESYTSDYSTGASLIYANASHASGITTNASNQVTATFAQSGKMTVVAAAWR